LYCVFDVQNLVLYLTCELLKILSLLNDPEIKV